MELRKFPVTAPDGTEYRVTIREVTDEFDRPSHAVIKIYVPRKRFGFRKIYRVNIENMRGYGPYDADRPDYVRLTEAAFYSYRRDTAIDAHTRRELSIRERQKREAAAKFNAWNGKVDV